jgi:hypothetical protein
MIQYKTLWNWTTVKLKRHPVRFLRRAVGINLTITISGLCTLPEPAVSVFINSDLRVEALF